MDIIVIIFILGAVAVMIFKKLNSFVYYIAMADILLRVINFMGDNIPIKVFTDFINKYFPSSLTDVINSYTSGLFATVLLWLLVAVYIMFLYYSIKVFLRKK